jgi:hypothetical protein
MNVELERMEVEQACNQTAGIDIDGHEYHHDE